MAKNEDAENSLSSLEYLLYDASNDEDVRRCWCKDNLFPQWADENNCLQTKLPPIAELLLLKHCWPTAWGDEVPEGVQFQ